mgnify:FL=1|tara:strand:+ start:214 stop:1431 length:1218 start_codon:yes stop_codon:yes gene_type:complete
MDEDIEAESPLSSLSASPEKNIRNRTFEHLYDERERFSSKTDRYLNFIGFSDDSEDLIDISVDSRDDSRLINIHPLEISENRNNIEVREDESINLLEENTINSSSTIFWEEVYLYYEERKSRFSYLFLVINISFFTYGLSKNGWKFLKTCPDDNVLFYDAISNWPECKDQRLQIWRFITSTFVHGDIWHLLTNLLIFSGYSFMLESSQKSISLFIIYLVTTIHTCIIFFIQNPYTSIIGCSNIVFSFIGAQIGDLILNLDFYSIDNRFAFLSFIPSLIIVLLEILSYTLRRSETVAYIAHWFGFLSGLIGSISIFKIFLKKSYKTILRFIALLIYFSMTIFLVNIYMSNYPPINSYDEFFTKKETIDCCYEWFKFKQKNNVDRDYFSNFTCPYIVDYTNMIDLVI